MPLELMEPAPRRFTNLFSERRLSQLTLSQTRVSGHLTQQSLSERARAAISFEANLAPKVLTNQPMCVCEREKKTHYFLRPFEAAREAGKKRN